MLVWTRIRQLSTGLAAQGRQGQILEAGLWHSRLRHPQQCPTNQEPGWSRPARPGGSSSQWTCRRAWAQAGPTPVEQVGSWRERHLRGMTASPWASGARGKPCVFGGRCGPCSPGSPSSGVGLAMSAQRRLWPLSPQAGQGSGQALGEGVLGVSRERAMLGSQIHRRTSLLSGCVTSAFPQVL